LKYGSVCRNELFNPKKKIRSKTKVTAKGFGVRKYVNVQKFGRSQLDFLTNNIII